MGVAGGEVNSIRAAAALDPDKEGDEEEDKEVFCAVAVGVWV